MDGWQLAPQQEAHAVSQPIYGVHLGKTRRSLLRQGDGRQTPPGILKPVLRAYLGRARGVSRRHRVALAHRAVTSIGSSYERPTRHAIARAATRDPSTR